MTNAELENLRTLITELASWYTREGNWRAFRQNEILWHRLIRRSVNGGEPETTPRPRAPLPQPLPLTPPRNGALGDQRGVLRPPPPPPPPPPREVDLDRLMSRLSLLDANKNLLAGPPYQSGSGAIRPIVVNEAAVGWVSLRKQRNLTHPLDVAFLKRQTRAFYVIGCVILLLAFVGSILIARHLASPIKQLLAGTRALRSLKFDARIPIRRSDELGQLAKEFDEMAQNLRRYEELRRQWLSDISHELRTPLSILRGEIEAVQDGVRTLNEKTLESLHAEVLYIHRLVEDLHLLSITESGALHYEKRPMDLLPVLERTVDSFRERLAARNIGVVLEARGEEPFRFQGDENRMAQVFSNILHNSERYTESPGTLWISYERREDTLFIEFQDSGPGVPDASLNRIFDRLYRVDPARSRKTGGSGLGLAISQRIVEAHGGTIAARKAAMGGLGIEIRLPLETD